MTFEEKQQWLKDLRSGEYKQCYGSLFEINLSNNNTTYCCLGVLREQTRFEYLTLNDIFVHNGLNQDQKIEYLIHLNDVKKKTFSEIADWIEENVEIDS